MMWTENSVNIHVAYQSKCPKAKNIPKPKHPLVKTSPSQKVPKPKRSLVSSQSIISVKAVTIEFYCQIILWSKLILKLL